MQAIEEFNDVVREILGFYLDSDMGFAQALLMVIEAQKASAREHNVTIEETENDLFKHIDGDFLGGTYSLVHKETMKQTKMRLTRGGKNTVFSGNMSIVIIFNYWEDHYRNEIAKAFGKKKEELKSPIMGDLRLLRNSIVHHKAIALKEVERCEIVNWFKENDLIQFDRKQILFIVHHILNDPLTAD